MAVGFEAPHLPFLFTRVLVGDFDPVVRVLLLAVRDRWHDLPFCGRVTAQLVRNHLQRSSSLTFQKLTEEAFRCPLVLALLNQDIQHIPVLVYGSPKIATLALNRYRHLVEELSIAAPAVETPNAPGITGSELDTPLPHGLVGDDDAALGEEVFDISQTQRKALI